MAHDFGAENLEDGEQWLPSDFFSIDEVQASNKTSIPLSYCSSSKPSCMAVFHNSSASTSPHRHPHNRCLSKPPPNSQRFKPAIFYGSTAVSCGGGDAHDPCECRTGNSWTGCSPVYRLQRVNPVQTQIDPNVESCFIGERAWALQRTRSNLNRVLPGVGMVAHVGTGVFLPRISSNMCTAAVTRNNIRRSVGKEPRNMDRHEFQLPPRKISFNRRQEFCSVYPSAHEVRMPNNSNY